MKRIGWALVVIGLGPLVFELGYMAIGRLNWPYVHKLFEALFITELMVIELGALIIGIAMKRAKK